MKTISVDFQSVVGRINPAVVVDDTEWEADAVSPIVASMDTQPQSKITSKQITQTFAIISAPIP